MKSRMSRVLLKYGITTVVGGLMSFAVLFSQKPAEAATAAERYRILTDAFTIPGVILICVGTLVWISNNGMFYGLSYLATRAIRALIPMGRTFEKHERYGDYVRRKREEGGVHGYGFLFFTGAAFMVVAAVFCVLFYRAYS